MKDISHERAEKIARAHPCVICGEYSFKRLVVKAVAAEKRSANDEHWHVARVCGVCGAEQELGLDADGDIVYEN